ncbi:MAG: hypothetical protein HY456_02105 [Parcubacteria group bacterium]|nr:hypothetical protein [Parcubacteria group bacterium]
MRKDLDRKAYLDLYRYLLLTREVEGKVRAEFGQNERAPLVPSIALTSFGEEAVGIGSALAADPKKDWIAIGHRAIGACFVFGLTPEEHLSNHFLRSFSPMGGRDGNIHFGFPDRHIIRFISHMGANVPAACGVADALKYVYSTEKAGEALPVVICYFGDGAASQGAIHEAMNYAGARNLPVIFVIDNNRTAIGTPYEAQTGAFSIARRAAGYGFYSDIADGNDVLDVYHRTYQAIERARYLAAQDVKTLNIQRAPCILECRTFRMSGHNETEKVPYVNSQEYNEWIGRDPFGFYRNQLLRMKKSEILAKVLDPKERERISVPEFSEEELAGIDKEVVNLVQAAYEKAAQPSKPTIDNVSLSAYPRKYFAEKNPNHFDPEPAAAFSIVNRKVTKEERESTLTLAEAVKDALRQALENNPKVRIFGEDVCGAYGKKGGIFGITHGLPEKFNGGDFFGFSGKDRVFDTPIAEVAIIGSAIGHAIAGLVPVCEVEFMPFFSVAMGQLIDMAATYYFTTRYPLGFVVRTAYGLGFYGGDFHSSSRTEAMFYHTPGLKIVCPSTPYDAKGLILQAIEEEAPVIFMENIWGYSRVRGQVDKNYYTVPIGKAALRRKGSDITVVTWGARMYFDSVLPAVLEAEKSGASIDLIDLRTLKPLDTAAIYNSVAKTRRVLIAGEDIANGGIAESILAKIVQEYPDIRGKVLGAPDTPIPQFEDFYAPDMQKVLEAIEKLTDRRPWDYAGDT